jgi:hypothetical protein
MLNQRFEEIKEGDISVLRLTPNEDSLDIYFEMRKCGFQVNQIFHVGKETWVELVYYPRENKS